MCSRRRVGRLTACGVAALLMLSQAALPADAQIPQDEYLRFVPLHAPRIIRQTLASETFDLYGVKAPGFRDEAPRDGIDDARGAWLLELSTRFAPLMVRNSAQFPLDFRTFYQRGPFPIYVEEWDIARHAVSRIGGAEVDMHDVGTRCPEPPDDSADCRLVALVDRFGPGRQAEPFAGSAAAEREVFPLLHFDLPGHDEKTWKAAYGPDRRVDYLPAARVFAHPFVAAATVAQAASPRYELVLQYWFFYPANDGPNNHEGDWEHINVVVSPLSQVTAPLEAETMASLVRGEWRGTEADPLVIRRIEYYFHHYMSPIDFGRPNAYAPREAWRREVEALERAGESGRRVWTRIRERAWQDEAETAINVRPVVWIGGDGIGIQSVLEMPGLRDRDGHASYPFRGHYRRIGAGDVGERVLRDFDHQAYFARPDDEWPWVDDYGVPDRIALTPDWEHVIDGIRTDPTIRRDWSWLVLPLRFGYPASPSPAAGLVAHADMGNVSVVGPAYNDGWNRVGDSAGYERYDLVERSWAHPQGLTDSFFPRLGFLNAPILYFLFKPPLDLAWRTVALPVRAAAGARQPTFLPASTPATRAVSFESGLMVTPVPDEYLALFFSREQFSEIVVRLAQALPPEVDDIQVVNQFGWAAAPTYGVSFHLSPRFSVESVATWHDADVGFDLTSPQLTSPVRTRGRLEQFEYHGTLRFNLATGNWTPYVRYGHGITWYRLRAASVNGQRLLTADSPRFRPESTWRDLGFNATVLGGGLEVARLRVGPAWLGMKTSYSLVRHELGFERAAAVETFPALATLVAGTRFSVWRNQARLSVTVGF